MANILDTARTVYDLAMKGKTLELQEQVMQLRLQALEIQEENLKLNKENNKLKEAIELNEKMEFRRKVYWRDGDAVPFCPYCFEKFSLSIHLNGPSKVRRGPGQLYYCRECSTTYITRGGSDFTMESRAQK